MLKPYLSDLLILSGCLAITIGSALISPILALFVGGGFCVLGGIALAVYQWSQNRSAEK